MTDNTYITKWLQQKAEYIATMSKSENHAKLQHVINQVSNQVNTAASMYPTILRDYLVMFKTDLDATKASLIAQGKWALK